MKLFDHIFIDLCAEVAVLLIAAGDAAAVGLLLAARVAVIVGGGFHSAARAGAGPHGRIANTFFRTGHFTKQNEISFDPRLLGEEVFFPETTLAVTTSLV